MSDITRGVVEDVTGDIVDLHPGRWWRKEGDRHVCELCPRRCHLKAGQRGFCFVRIGTPDGVALTTWGRSSGFCLDPIEKKPLFHFLPGTSVLSFGTAGCNLGCRFCQNWDISKAREMDRLQDHATPERIAEAAVRCGSPSVAFTYNDPVIFAEYALDCAAACRARGIRTVAKTAGYITAEARAEFFAGMDAVNVDLKAFTESFYKNLCFGELAPVKEAILYLVREARIWTELTTLLIPGENDSEEELHALSTWVHDSLGPDVPLHFTAYHPDYKLTNAPTPRATLRRARQIGLEHGLRYVYTGNLPDPDGESTHCVGCGRVVIGRQGYQITAWALDAQGRCQYCATKVPGVFQDHAGAWGGRRVPIHLGGG